MVEPVELEVNDSPCVGEVADVDGGDAADQQDDTQPVLRRSERVTDLIRSIHCCW